MQVDLQRTFGGFSDQPIEEDEYDWAEYFSPESGRMTWTDLHVERVVVVLGEAGIGKTTEFRLEAQRLTQAGKAAFFLPLNLLANPSGWGLALADDLHRFTAWQQGHVDAHFFLDAVDEARLRAPEDLLQALLVVKRELGAHLARVRIAISSRITDWSIPAVREAVERYLAKPVQKASTLALITAVPEGDPTITRHVPSTQQGQLRVVTLDPLSRSEAQRYAHELGLVEEAEFWREVDQGDYDFMVSRPLDLRWMVDLWNDQRTLGGHLELVETNVRNRLQEFNESYLARGLVLSPDELLHGARELAAAAEFGGYAYLGIHPSEPTSGGVLRAADVLQDWGPMEVQRLLATAVFDEASLGRVQFHHRSIREYLAACWIEQKLRLGVPFERLRPMLATVSFGALTVIPSRRAVIGWLAAINAVVRAWVVARCPELLLYEGDPQSWDRRSADLAFQNLVERTLEERRVSWFLSSSEWSRLSRALTPRLVSERMSDVAEYPARSWSFHIARYGRLIECRDVAFQIYQDARRSEWERCLALAVLGVTANPEQRAEVLLHIESGLMVSNELLASALQTIEWKALDVHRLSRIFESSLSEADYGAGPLARAIKEELLPKADLAAATNLLASVYTACPEVTDGSLVHFPRESQPDRAWLFEVLPDCLQRVLELLQPSDAEVPEICLSSVELVETMRDTGFPNREELRRLHLAIQALPHVRWRAGQVIAGSKVIRHPLSRLTWGTSCLVSFGVQDLPQLIGLANDAQLSPDVREIWFQTGMVIALRDVLGNKRSTALRALCKTDESSRFASIQREFLKMRSGRRERRSWEREETERQAKKELDFIAYVDLLKKRTPQIADCTDIASLTQVFRIAYDIDNSGVDLDAIGKRLSPEIASAFSLGLDVHWRKVAAPSPFDYPNGQVPWSALVALAGVSVALADESAIASLSHLEVVNAAKIAVWAQPSPPEWLVPLHQLRKESVEGTLIPWIVQEAKSLQKGAGSRRTLSMALNCQPVVRSSLLLPLSNCACLDEVPDKEVLSQLVAAMAADRLLSEGEIAEISLRELKHQVSMRGSADDLSWLKTWASIDASSAWAWFQQLLKAQVDPKDLISEFVDTMGDLKWTGGELTQQTVDLLLEMISTLKEREAEAAGVQRDADVRRESPAMQLQWSIAKLFVSRPSLASHSALKSILAVEGDHSRRWSISGLVIQHAESVAQASALWSADRLAQICSPFGSQPRTERQLYEQVCARLEEIQTMVEEGPFSERDLFSPRMKEKFLQRWLAAKLWDTQQRRFSVHREEELDDDKMPDIQLSCAAGNVCLEVKPLDSSRSYSANSLVTDTLERQLVGQYLKGMNSGHGILVLLQLDNKQWELPGQTGLHHFSKLIDYLHAEAQRIKHQHPTVAELAVLGISCLV